MAGVAVFMLAIMLIVGRPVADAASQERVRDLVLQAYAEYEESATQAAS
jgi:hypothetical protein